MRLWDEKMALVLWNGVALGRKRVEAVVGSLFVVVEGTVVALLLVALDPV